MRKHGSRNAATILLIAGLGTAVMLSASIEAGAQTGGDKNGGFLVYPNVKTRAANLVTGAPAVDTLIQLSNTAADPVWVQCYYINANGRCGAPDGDPCWTSDDCVIQIECDPNTSTCGGIVGPDEETCSPSTTNTCPSITQACLAGWAADRDFTIRLTQGQPIGWSAATGLISGSPGLPCDNPDPEPCPSQNQGLVLPVSEPELFRGELKCVQREDDDGNPGRLALANDLNGNATIIEGGGAEVNLLSGSYNAVSFVADPDTPGTAREDNVLCLGDHPSGDQASCSVNYTPCSNVVVVEHFFDGATLPLPGNDATVETRLVLVPCSEDLAGTGSDDDDDGLPPEIPTQVLVFNEFEQRYSTDLDVQCYRDTLLSDIDTRVNDPSDNRFSLFAFQVQGTLTGQTRLRGVGGSSESGVGLLAVTHEFYTPVYLGDDDDDDDDFRGPVASAAYNSHMDSGMSRGDVVKARNPN